MSSPAPLYKVQEFCFSLLAHNGKLIGAIIWPRMNFQGVAWYVDVEPIVCKYPEPTDVNSHFTTH